MKNLRPSQTPFLQYTCLSRAATIGRRACSCSAPLAVSETHALPRDPQKTLPPTTNTLSREQKLSKPAEKPQPKADHQVIGRQQSLFFPDVSSPGAPFFQPDGTHIFQKLTSFLRAQYTDFGFREVITPTFFKQTLWEKSGHWANYKDDMFTVIGKPSQKLEPAPLEVPDERMQPKKDAPDDPELEQYGLKPMNCPGHCILFQSKRRSYRDLPIRYAEFSPLHRNEISGALSGLTRVRRFHQDDGHIFCRPSQVMEEILRSIKFIKMIYSALHLYDYRFVLSTRPKKDYIGTMEEWDRAEDHLRRALDSVPEILWTVNEGDGAFYGPKIDVTLRDSDGKEHQTATIQLDFQLPKRFNLKYDAPAPDLEAQGDPTQDSRLRDKVGKVTPVMIHRAVLGSLERFMALMLEEKDGKLPFWLSPRQIIVLTVTDRDFITAHAKEVRQTLSNVAAPPVNDEEPKPRKLDSPRYIVDMDDSGDSIAQKIARATQRKYNMICVVGEKNVKSGTVDVTFHGQPNLEETWNVVEEVKLRSQPPMQMGKATGGIVRGNNGINLTTKQCRNVIERLSEEYL